MEEEWNNVVVITEPEDIEQALECRVDYGVNPYTIDAPVPGYCIDCGD